MVKRADLGRLLSGTSSVVILSHIHGRQYGVGKSFVQPGVLQLHGGVINAPCVAVAVFPLALPPFIIKRKYHIWNILFAHQCDTVYQVFTRDFRRGAACLGQAISSRRRARFSEDNGFTFGQALHGAGFFQQKIHPFIRLTGK